MREPSISEPGASFAAYLMETGHPEAVAVIEPGRTVSYEELRADVSRILAELEALGVPPGARIAILGDNSAFWVAGYLAALHRYVAVPFSNKLPIDEISRLAQWSECAAVIVDPRSERALNGSLEDVPRVTVSVLQQHEAGPWPPSRVDPDADAALMFTSGTTARPKAVRVTHRNLRANTASIVEYLGLRSDDRMLVVLPFFYCYGASLLHTHLRVGGSVALCNTFTFPETALAMIEREQCTGLAGVPSTYQLLLRASGFKTRSLPSLRLIQQAGGKLPPVLIQELIAAQPQAQVFVMYGQTEATARLSYLPPDLLPTELGSIGRGIPGVQLQVVDSGGSPVAPGEVGEIMASGENISPGYVNDPGATAEKFGGGVLHTGDLAVVDDEGYIFIVDRIADFTKTWGYRVSSQEVEGAALELTDLVSAAAVGIPDPDAGEVIALMAVPRPGATVTPDDVTAHLRARLAKHMVPRFVHFARALPLNDNGKVSKARVRTLVTEALAAEDPAPSPSPF